MKGEIKSNTIIVGDINIPSHLWIDQLNRKLTRKQTLNDAMAQEVIYLEEYSVCT